MKQLIAVGSVVLKVGTAVRTFEHGTPLPKMPAAEQERLQRLGAAREAIVESAPKAPPAGKDAGGDGTGDSDPPA